MRERTLTSKHQATMPSPLRQALGLKAGDAVAFEILSEHGVHLHKAAPLDVTSPRVVEGALASEGLSKTGDEAYREL